MGDFQYHTSLIVRFLESLVLHPIHRRVMMRLLPLAMMMSNVVIFLFLLLLLLVSIIIIIGGNIHIIYRSGSVFCRDGVPIPETNSGVFSGTYYHLSLRKRKANKMSVQV
jgi:hypothetical protein